MRIVCEQCSGELQVPRSAAGKAVRCPYCGALCDMPDVGAFEAMTTTTGPWISEEELDGPTPWWLVLTALAPLGLLYFVEIEPVSMGVASVLVVLSLLVAMRRTWPRMARFAGVVCLALIGFGATAAVHLTAGGNFANLFAMLGDVAPVFRSDADLAAASWKELTFEDFACQFPGEPTERKIEDPEGNDVLAREARFGPQDAVFAVHRFGLRLEGATEKTELLGFLKMEDVVGRLFFEGDVQAQHKVWLHEHPGVDQQYTVLGKKTRIVVRAYLIRDRVVTLSVASAKLEAIEKDVRRFFDSLRLTKPIDGFRSPVADAEPDWKSLGRDPIPREKPLLSLRGHHKPPVLFATFTQDGKGLYTGSGRERLVHWNLETGVGRLQAATETHAYFAVEPKRLLLAAPVYNGVRPPIETQFVSLEVATPAPLGSANTDMFGFTPEGTLALTPLGGDLTAWDLASGQKLWHRLAHLPTVTTMALSRDGRLAATVGPEEPIIKLWDVTKRGADLAMLKGHAAGVRLGSPIQQLAFSPDAKTLASAGLDATVRVWSLLDPNQPKLARTLTHDQPVACVEHAPVGSLVATGDFHGIVRVWDISQGKMLSEWRASEACEPVQFLRYSPDGTRLAVAVEMGLDRAGVKVYDTAKLPAARGPSVTFQQTEEPPLFDAAPAPNLPTLPKAPAK